MAVGDMVSDLVSTATTATADVRPGSGAEWLVTTLKAESGKSFSVESTADSGSTWKLIDTFASGGSVHGLQWRLTNAKYIRLKNNEGDTRYIGYEGVITK